MLERWLPSEDRDEILGDLDEQFEATLDRRGFRQARRWYRRQTVDLVFRYRRTGPADARPGGHPFMLMDDLRHVLRRVRAHPAGTLLAAALLAAAIGLSTGTFAVVDSLMLERAPFDDPDRLRAVSIQRRYAGGDNPELVRLMRAWRETGIFEAVEAAGVVRLTDEASAGPAGTAALVSPGLFEMLGVRPVHGRAFTEDDARAGDVEPIVISEGLWRQAFGGDRARLGSLVSLGGREYRLVGVMPAEFRFPASDTVAWRPLSFDAMPFPAAAGQTAYVRVPANVPTADVLARATRIAGEADTRFTARPNELYSRPIGGDIDENAGRALPLFAGAVGLIFLALCANASSLLLAGMMTRRRELGIRLSLGASRGRVLRECVLEHALIGAAGVGGGIAIAHGLTAAAPRFMTDGFSIAQTLNPIDVDGRALAIAAALGVVAVLLAGVLPALIGTRLDPALSVKPSERTQTESRPARTMTRALLVAQIAFASMLVLGAALLVQSFDQMATADRGMNARDVRTLTAFMKSVSAATLDDLEARVGTLPGVEDVTVAGAAPPHAGSTATTRWTTDVVSGLEFPLYIYDIRPDFFRFYDIRLVSGRYFRPGETDVTIIGERVAGLLWPDADPLGKIMSAENGGMRLRVIGVAREVTLPSLDERAELPEIYLPYSGRRSVLTISWRCSTDCPIRQQIVDRIHEVDAGAEPLHLNVVEESFARQLVRPRAAAQLGATFASVGFVTSGAGLFAVLSYAVGRRRRELGIRTALGATPAVLRRSVSAEALGIAAPGLAIGGAGAWMLQRVLASVTYGVSAFDPLAWFAMILIVTTTTLVAAWRPARQAARADPVELLRAE
jgi:predicted permease